MREAGVDLVTVGIFSWALLEPEPGRFELRLARPTSIDLLHEAGIARRPGHRHRVAAALAHHAHPEVLPVHATGRVLWPGGRQAWCPSSPVYRERALRAGDARSPSGYGDHPALALWHVSQRARRPQRALLLRRVAPPPSATGCARATATLDALNDAWGTAFWSQRYGDWAEVLPPRAAPTFANPTQQLDFLRFSSDALLDYFTAERDLLHQLSPGVPVTTNFMVMEHVRAMDYLAWGRELDLVVQRPLPDGARPATRTSSCRGSADLTRGLARRAAVAADGALDQRGQLAAAQRRQGARPAARATASRTSPAARTRCCFFQWRASRAGAEKFHSAMLPHAGTDSRGLARGGRPRRRRSARSPRWPAPGCGPRSRWSWTGTPGGPPSWTATPRPTSTYLDRHLALYRALWDAGVAVDLVGPEADLTGYRLVLVPTLYLVTDAGAANLGAVRRRRRHRRWSPTGAASSTRTTTSGSAATRAPSATCSACARRSSSRCARVRRCGSPEVFSTVPRPTCGPRRSTCAAPRRSRPTPTARCPAHPP